MTRIIKVGALFAGYGGIELALAQVAAEHPGVRVELVWYCEVDPAASKIMAHHFPDAVNLGDVTKVDWAEVLRIYGPIDVICGGSPCQDLSHAGKRKGMTNGTRSNLWESMREAIAVLRPRLVVWENVRGALSATASSDVEREQGLLGVRRDGPSLRAIGRVVGDLASLRYVGRYYGLRAADVGGAHGRFRVFLFATPADAGSIGWGEGARDWAGPSAASGAGQAGGVGGRGLLGVDGPHVPGQLTLLPTPSVADALGGHLSRSGDRAHELLLPGVAKALSAPLLPTPRATDGTKGGPNQRGSSGDLMLPSAVQDWREYEAAIRRCEHAWGRPAPLPTEPGKNGQPRLSPRFVEWLMGLPEGHVTDPAIGISRNDQLKALGNGVVPQQCAAALRAFLNDTAMEAAS